MSLDGLIGRRARVRIGHEVVTGEIAVVEPAEGGSQRDEDRIVEVRLPVHHGQRYAYRRRVSEIELVE